MSLRVIRCKAFTKMHSWFIWASITIIHRLMSITWFVTGRTNFAVLCSCQNYVKFSVQTNFVRMHDNFEARSRGCRKSPLNLFTKFFRNCKCVSSCSFLYLFICLYRMYELILILILIFPYFQSPKEQLAIALMDFLIK